MNCFPEDRFVLLRSGLHGHTGWMCRRGGDAGQLWVWCFSKQSCVTVSWGAQTGSHC